MSAPRATATGGAAARPLGPPRDATGRPSAALLALMGYWGYVSGIHGSVAPLLAASFGLGDAQVAALFSWIGVASLLALVVGRASDRIGRRRALLGCAAGLPLAAAASALAPSPGAYLAAQLAAFGLGSALLATVTVAVAERRSRGSAVPGATAARASPSPSARLCPSSRAPLSPSVPRDGAASGPSRCSRSSPCRGSRGGCRRTGGRAEPPRARATSETSAGSGVRSGLRALLAPAHRRRVLAALGAAIAISAAEAATRAWLFYHPVRSLGLAPRSATALLLVGGSLGLAGFRLGGRLADARGRRPALLAGGSLFALGVAGFYGATPPRGAAGLVWLGASLFALAAGGNAAIATFRAHAAELLPLPSRQLRRPPRRRRHPGWSLSMWAVATLTAPVGGIGHAVTCVVLVALPTAALLLRGLPETAVPARPASAHRPDPSPARSAQPA